MASQEFRDKLSFTLIGLIIFLFGFAVHTYAAFCHTASSDLYDFTAIIVTLEIIGTVGLLMFLSLSIENGRPAPSILLGVVALLPCVIVWIVGAGLDPWPLAFWVDLVIFWAAYATEFFFGPLSRTIDALYALNTRLHDRRRPSPSVERARGLSRSPSSRRNYAFTELSSSPTLNGSPRDVPGTPVQAAVKDADDMV